MRGAARNFGDRATILVRSDVRYILSVVSYGPHSLAILASSSPWIVLMNPSFKPEEYVRRITDIRSGLDALRVTNSNKGVRFLGYFFGCEKLAVAIVGIANTLPADDVFKRGFSLKLDELIAAADRDKLNLSSVSPDDLTWLFANENQTTPNVPTPNSNRLSARELRNKVVHHFGPTHVGFLYTQEPFFTPIMTRFLACDAQVLKHIKP